MPPLLNPNWPVLTQYNQDHLERIALPLGGIGTGTVSLGGRGDLRDWEIVNRPAKGFAPSKSNFNLYVKAAGKEPVCRALEGLIDEAAYEGGFGCSVANHSLPRFRKASFHAAYPLGQVLLSDPAVPVDVRLEGFNPLIGGDADASGIPAAVLRFVLTNRTDKPLEAAICGSVENFIGTDGTNGKPCRNVNEFRSGSKGLSGLFMRSNGLDPDTEQWGTMALATTAKTGVSHRTTWLNLGWSFDLLDFWDDFSTDGKLKEPAAPDQQRDNPHGSLAVKVRLAPRATESITFLLCWHFPNRMTWTPKQPAEKCGSDCGCKDPNNVGNYYTTQYADAWEVAARTAKALPKLEADTVSFVRAICDCDLPADLKEAALYNLSTLRSQTTFRTADGLTFGWEGCGDKTGCCHGTCTHVWNYEQATPFLFGDLAWGMREVEFAHATDENGHMRFRVDLPLTHSKDQVLAAADGQMGCIMKLYREWKLSGDDARMERLYGQARRAVEFCWTPGGWDADRDGVMEGPQHNTMDVEYYGPNAQMTGWYLGALRALEEMAMHIGQADFAQTCRRLFENGSAWMDKNLFNGEYYEQKVMQAQGDVRTDLAMNMNGKFDPRRQEVQLGNACLVDQLVGQYMAHVCGLGYLHDPAKVKKTLQSIMKYNWRENFFGHFNHLRTFVLNDEQALLMASYPKGKRPRFPFPYFSEVMTGFEYTAGAGMIYEGQVKDGLKVISAIRRRYDGRKRNPFNEAECGHHYARAMASWASLLAMTGFQYDARTQHICFNASPKKAGWFWSVPSAWGTVHQNPQAKGVKLELTVLHGSLKLRTIELNKRGSKALEGPITLSAGKTLACLINSKSK